jgi:hypothetical protein
METHWDGASTRRWDGRATKTGESCQMSVNVQRMFSFLGFEVPISGFLGFCAPD